MNEFTSKIKGKKGLRKKQEKGLRLEGNKKRKDKYKKVEKGKWLSLENNKGEYLFKTHLNYLKAQDSIYCVPAYPLDFYFFYKL